jgi:hypothetical protein
MPTLGTFVRIAAATLAGAWPCLAQSFVSTPSQLPANTGFTENVDFADVDGDGDRDAAIAEGGDSGNDQNNLWINRGFEPGGTLGVFADRTATQFPSVLDTSRDVDFADLDGDGDFDLAISNTSTVANQSNRWWINMGGAQGGTPGFFTDQTAARWKFIGVNDGVSHFSSVATALVLPSGGFVDWSCDAVLGDLDSDGDLDVFQSSYGGSFTGLVPSRIFLNDGGGAFEEFNPSGVQLAGGSIPNGTPGLWSEGVHQHDTQNTSGAQGDVADAPLGVELGDVDGDLDLDVLKGARDTTPRLHRNRLADTGAFTSFRDVSFASGYTSSVGGGGNYEQELGDFDGDLDLDLIGVNWPAGQFPEVTLRNDGAGVFGSPFQFAGSLPDDNEADFFDYDNDGRLDVFVTNFAGQDRLYRNDGPPSWTHSNVTAVELPVDNQIGLGGDSCDIDLDGDYDFLVTNNSNQLETLLVNHNQILDTTAPRIGSLEQAPNSVGAPAPVAIRAQVYDNSSWDVARFDVTVLEYSTNGGGSWSQAPMVHAGGQLFRGAIPAGVTGSVLYRVRSTDEHGNTGVSVAKSYSTGCAGGSSYCTAGTTSHGCTATMSSSGVPSVAASSGFTLTASGVEGQRGGLIFYGISGRIAVPWGSGSTSFLCVKSPVQRTALQGSGGTSGQCDGALSVDWLAYLAATPGALGQPFGPGQVVDAQAWFRDPPGPKTTALSDAFEFTTCP